ncbi:hypothetical protein [Pleionea sediminis]|uniref:hypothetical protein n=1 Tax=Pleionea sediminis TaxID=2569479 RepID=UPI0011848C3B|nr:hypothetical protein [Pleionea sediminis]
MHNDTFDKILSFLKKVDIDFSLCSISETTFLPGMKIENGALLIDTERLEHSGDILHEAGHIAISTEEQRFSISGDAKDFGHSASDEMAAIAWSWAAIVHINLPPDVVFHPDGYKGGSNSIINAFQNGHGFGYPMLYSWYMCELPTQPNGFPKMLSWLRSEKNHIN